MSYIPIDNKEMTEKYGKETGGICGQACLAVIEHGTIKGVLEDWKWIVGPFKGWTGWYEMKKYLVKKGFTVKHPKEITKPEHFHIARVQWLGDENKNLEKPFYGWPHWTVASSHTHFILIKDGEFFCNDDACWRKVELLKEYLGAFCGVITSYMEIWKEDG